MELVGWILAIVLAIAVVVLFLRKPEERYASAVDRLTRDMERGGDVPAVAADDPPEVASLRRRVSGEWRSVDQVADEDPGDRALRGLVRYLEGAALEPLREATRGVGGDAAAQVQGVIDALEDLRFYAVDPDGEKASRQDLAALIQEVARDYTRETEIAVKLSFTSPSLRVPVPVNAFKDALFLLLSNAGRFGEGRTVTVIADESEDGVRVRVTDRGAGFSEEALERAFEPFWSTDRDAAGLGLAYARRVLDPFGVRVRIGNREEGGGEATLVIPRG